MDNVVSTNEHEDKSKNINKKKPRKENEDQFFMFFNKYDAARAMDVSDKTLTNWANSKYPEEYLEIINQYLRLATFPVDATDELKDIVALAARQAWEFIARNQLEHALIYALAAQKIASFVDINNSLDDGAIKQATHKTLDQSFGQLAEDVVYMRSSVPAVRMKGAENVEAHSKAYWAKWEELKINSKKMTQGFSKNEGSAWRRLLVTATAYELGGFMISKGDRLREAFKKEEKQRSKDEIVVCQEALQLNARVKNARELYGTFVAPQSLPKNYAVALLAFNMCNFASLSSDSAEFITGYNILASIYPPRKLAGFLKILKDDPDTCRMLEDERFKSHLSKQTKPNQTNV